MKTKIVAVIGLLMLLALENSASAHTGINDSLPGTNRAGYVYATINAPCDLPGWDPVDGGTLGGDTDGDGICNEWELSSGLKVDFAPPPGQTGNGQRFKYEYKCVAGGGIDPQCPSPTKKDVYVELDWMHDPNNSHVPLAGVVQAVQDAYANSPVLNSGSTNGIVLHVQYGERPDSSSGSEKGDINFHKDALYTNQSTQTGKTGFYRLKQYTFGTVCERFWDTQCPTNSGTFLTNPNYNGDTVKNLLTAKFQVFHYALVINQRAESGENTSTGWAEQFGNDEVWSLGYNNMGNAEQQKAVFMHELGHNFDLKHGGADDTKYKPNYFSVMNPMFEFKAPDPSGLDKCRPLDYSNKAMNTVVENNLVENNGVRDSSGLGYKYPASPSCLMSWTGNAAGASLANQPTPTEVANTERFFWYTTPGSSSPQNAFDRTNQGVNWDNDTPADDNDIITSGIDINSEGGNAQTLTSLDDWSLLQIKFDFGLGPWQAGATAGSLPGDPDQAGQYPPGEECGETTDPLPGIDQLYNTGCTEIHLPQSGPDYPIYYILGGIAAVAAIVGYMIGKRRKQVTNHT